MKITRSDLFNMVQAFGSLGGRMVEASDGDKKTVILKPYDIDGAARYAVAKMKRAAKDIMQAIEDERTDLVAKSGLEPAALEMDKAKLATFKAEMAAYLKEEVEFTEHRIQVGTLKVGANQLDPAVIEALLPVLDGEV